MIPQPRLTPPMVILTACVLLISPQTAHSSDYNLEDMIAYYDYDPAPPLNGTGHAWHHPQKVLIDVIKNGTARLGGNMPPWKDRLSDQEIEDIIAWFKAQWPDELYAAWDRMNREHDQK